MGSRPIATVLAAMTLCAAAASALAQDYNVSSVTGRYVSSPANATSVMAGTDDGATTLNLPFSFVYFGRTFTTCSACTNGFIQFGGQAYTQWNTSGFTFSALSGQLDGMCAPYWDDTNYGNGGAVKYWVEGAAPDRRFIVAWENMRDYYDAA